MAIQERTSHILTGFAASASAFVNALDGNRLRIAREAGVNGTELRALFRVARVVSVTPKDLAAHLGMTTGAITAISRRLVDMGLVDRVDHPDDRRSLYLELSPKGNEVMESIHREFTAMLSASTSSLNARQLADFTAALESVATEVRERSGQA
ncbi:MarR family transcriptional regulator [Salinibacterium sp.]|uniref:MarR family winged helix-turn-helix transcriptional regulator n=1 Tax=Salinibacterium sp. TaxID=1915057 RepID=UPI00286A4D53|nr:MarR family transcriptional regulator [Salinibacterium sp.]